MFLNKKDKPETAYAAIYEYEITQRRLGQFRCIYPTADRVETLGPLLQFRSPLDKVLEKWLHLNEEERLKYLQEIEPEFSKYFEQSQ